MDVSSPVNPGSTRSWKKCQACRVQKVKCIPAFRDWPGEKCERCEKHGLPCGPNISCKESRVDPAAHGTGSPEQSHEEDEYHLLQPNRLSFESAHGQGMGQAKLPSQHMHVVGQPAGFEQSNTTSFTSSGPFSMGFLNLTPDSNSESSSIQPNVAILRTRQRVEELQKRLRMLDKRVGAWTYLRNALKSMEETGNKDQGLYHYVRMLQINIIGGEIKSIIDQVESLGDQAAANGDKFHAEVAYTRLIKACDKLEDPGFICIHPLLTKISEFYAKNDEPFQATEILRRLFDKTSTSPARHDSCRLLANSYQEISAQMAKIFEGLSLDGTPLYSETPCPAFHCAIQDQVPEEVLNIMSESSDSPDILRRQNIHAAIEARRDTLIGSLIKFRPGLGVNVDDRDAFSRTPLHLATQLRRCTAFHALVMAGADRKARDATGRTTLEMAARVGCSKMVIALLDNRINDASADVNDLVFYNTSTPLQAAAEEGHGEVVDILLDHGAKVSQVRRYDGKTAAQLALERGHTDIADRIDRLIPRESVDPMLCTFGLDEMCA